MDVLFINDTVAGWGVFLLRKGMLGAGILV